MDQRERSGEGWLRQEDMAAAYRRRKEQFARAEAERALLAEAEKEADRVDLTEVVRLGWRARVFLFAQKMDVLFAKFFSRRLPE